MSFVFVCMLLIKGDGIDFATNAFIAVGSATVLTLSLSLLGKHLWEIIRKGSYLDKAKTRCWSKHCGLHPWRAS